MSGSTMAKEIQQTAPSTAPTSSTPLAEYGMLADCNSAAHVSRAGSVDWLCLPRYDSPAIFARLLGPDAGHWSIRPAAEFHGEHRYLPGTLVLETTFTTAGGTVKLTDALAFAEGQRGHDLGLASPHELLRLVEGVSGTVELELELAPRPEYGLVRPLFRHTTEGGRTFGGPTRVAVTAGVPVEIADATMRATFTLGEGEQAGFALRWAAVEDDAPEPTPAGHRGRADHGHGRRLALVGGRARHLRRAAPRARAHQLARAQGADLSSDRRDRRRRDHVAPRGRGRRAQLGLPLRMDPGREPDARGALHRLLLGRSRGVHLLHDQRGRRQGQGRLAADHVRDRRRARPVRARARPPAGLARLAPGARRQRGLDPDAARCLRRAAERAVDVPRATRRAAPRDPGVRRGARRCGGGGLAPAGRRHVGDARRSRSTISPRRCSAGRRSTAP